MEEKVGVKLRLWPLLGAVLLGVSAAWVVEAGLLHPARHEAPRPTSLDPPAPSAPHRTLEAQGPPEPPPPAPAPPADEARPPPSPPKEASVPPAPGGGAPARASVPGEKLRFREIWAYLLPGGERVWPEASPITDLGLFDFSLDPTGRLSGKADRAAIERAAKAGVRTHLVVASSGNQALLHFVLSPRYGVRQTLIQEIADLPRRHGADGVQLDLEGPRAQEREELLSFVRELRAALPTGARLSLALPAKTSDGPGAYVYQELAGAADRLFIMVYDQHWRGGPPGPVSALEWHDRVLACLLQNLPPDRVVVGIPFYGRVWQKETVARALPHGKAEDLATERSAAVKRDAGSPSFTFRTEVTAECWFEDAASLRLKLESARSKGFLNVGFWRLGQEDPRIWETLERE